MPDNWMFVFAAYALGAIVLGAYWRSLDRRDRQAQPRAPLHRRQTASRAPLQPHPRPEPASRPPRP